MSNIKKFFYANKFPWDTFKKYLKYSSKSELVVDVALPIVASILLLIGTSFFVSDFKVLIEKLQQLSGQVIAAISILAGFNITSITVIATVGSHADQLRSRISSDGQVSVYDMLIGFFTWAVTIQLIVVLFSILLFYIGSLTPINLAMPIPIWGWGLAAIWLSLTIHSILISIRNIKTLFHYVTYTP
ncbi:hypothetical protein [Paenibacillus shenyangensis]|uniref:hypothetical protein n=1 Tax=Paenibacillus sp. A9 TaxID=1284352 RepID=UPI00037E3731|nr:hypothetical protein [Paenibacillus sp. A9]